MPFVSLKYPPGVYKNGTRLQARGRWFDASLVRWFGDAMQPVGGWEAIEFTTPDIPSTSEGSTGFGDFDTGELPDGFEEVQVTGLETAEHDWTIEEDEDAFSGQLLRLPDEDNNAYLGGVIWTDAADFGDGEVLALVRFPSGSSTSARAVGVGMRVSGADGKLTGVFARLRFFSPPLLVSAADDEAGFGSVFGSSSLSLSGVNKGDPWWIRMQIEDGTCRVRAWSDDDDEPGSWQVEEDLPGNAPATGQPAIIAQTNQTSTAAQEAEIVAYEVDSTGVSTPSDGGTTITTAVDGILEPSSGMLAWRDNDNVAWLAIGTPTRAFVYSEGLLREITPSGFSTGLTDASSQIAGYGTGAYGAGIYGEGVSQSVGTILEAQSWQFDNFGQLLVAVAHSDGKLYSFTPNTTEVLSELDEIDPLTDEAPATEDDEFLPEDNLGLVVTPERFLVALGAGDDPRTIQWADQESLSKWRPTTENQAGDFVLPGTGSLMAGHRGRGETLLWTTQDLFTMQYIGGTLVYSVNQVGANCGLIGRRAFASVGGSTALWMGYNAFYVYDGSVRPLPCDVSDFVFNDINREQASKIHTQVFPEFSEVWWFYCPDGSTDVTKYVSFNYQENHWAIGELTRTGGVPRGVFDNPVMMDDVGVLYLHEKGATYLDTDGSTGLVPFAESGPFQIAEGDRTMVIREIIPDENTLGDVQAYLTARLYPTATAQEFGPFTLAEPTSVRLSGRQVSLKVEQVETGWRVGVPRLDVVPAGRR